MDLLKNIILNGEYDKIHGWCTKEKALKLADIVEKSNSKLIVELGVFGGRSLLPMALASRNAKVIGIDAWEVEASLEGENSKENDEWWSKIDNNMMMQYTENLLKSYGCSNFELWRTKSNKVSDKFLDESIDVLHQDSNHSEIVSCEEVELYWNKVKYGGTWIFDDTDWATTKKAQELLLTKGYIELFDANSWKIYVRAN